MRKTVDYLWRKGAKYGGGSTGDMIRDEIATGARKSASGSHLQKAQDALNTLRKLIVNGGLSKSDRKVAFEIIED